MFLGEEHATGEELANIASGENRPSEGTRYGPYSPILNTWTFLGNAMTYGVDRKAIKRETHRFPVRNRPNDDCEPALVPAAGSRWVDELSVKGYEPRMRRQFA